MIRCRDIQQMNLDGMTLIAGKNGLDRVVSWTYVVMTRPFDDHMNQGDFALCVVDFERLDFDEVYVIMQELNELKISGFAISVKEDQMEIPEEIVSLADKLELPLFKIRWNNASFVDIAQSIGNSIVAENTCFNKKGEFLYNLLFGYDINEQYINKVARQFDMDFSVPYRVGIIVVDRNYGKNHEQDEHTYTYYMSSMAKMVSDMKEPTMFMTFLNKGVILFPTYEDHHVVKQLERLLTELDQNQQFQNRISSTCILGRAYLRPQDFAKSYQEAKSLICKKDILRGQKKVISSNMLGIYQYLFESSNQEKIHGYCDEKLRKLEEYDNVNNTDLTNTVLAYYMNGFNISKTATALFVHRNTLQYRLTKISELLGFELDDYMEYLELLNCILLKKMIFSDD